MSGTGVPDSELTDCHLRPYIADRSSCNYELAVVIDDRPDQFEEMIGKLFDRQPVSVTDAKALSAENDLVALLEDGDLVATSPLSMLSETILLVNSDLYRTGSVGLDDIDLPDVIAELADTTFHARGYPESNYEKLPLILISRWIERLSYTHGGVHSASFQRLSRIRDERGTHNVYRKLGAADVTTHVYGVPDWLPPREMNVTVHAGYGGDWDSSWFVLHRSQEVAAALVALEVDVNEWKAQWTFDRSTVADIEETITQYL